MRILFLDQFSDLGGAQGSLLDLIPAVQERGWTARALLPGDGPLVDRLQAAGVDVDEIPCGPYRSGAKSAVDFIHFPLDVRQQTKLVANVLHRHDFHLLYVNGPRLLPAAVLAAGKRVPMLFHAHSLMDQGYSRSLIAWALRRSKATVIACSDFVAATYRGYLPDDRIHVVSNGVADLGYVPRGFDKVRRWRIGVVGRIAPEKGQIDFLRAAALLTASVPNARFVICGAPILSTRSYSDEVHKLARGLPVDFLGWRDNIAPVLGELDLVVIPSKQEAQSRVMLEAFSAGVPVVAYPVGGIPEALHDGVTGFLTAGVTPGDLASRIHEVISGDPKELSGVTKNAREAWRRSHTVTLFRERVTTLMEQSASVPLERGETALPQTHR